MRNDGALTQIFPICRGRKPAAKYSQQETMQLPYNTVKVVQLHVCKNRLSVRRKVTAQLVEFFHWNCALITIYAFDTLVYSTLNYNIKTNPSGNAQQMINAGFERRKFSQS